MAVRQGGKPPSDLNRSDLKPPRNHASRPYLTTPVKDAQQHSVGVLYDCDTGLTTSGFLVAPDVLLTAAHCVFPAGRFDRAGAFWFGLPHQRPKRLEWVAIDAIGILAGFVERRDYKYDLAICHLAEPQERHFYRPLKGVQADKCQIFGYPRWTAEKSNHYGGFVLWSSQSTHMEFTPQAGWAATNLSEGCSGGPWLIETAGGLQPIGLTSRGGDGFLLSPPFNSGGLSRLLKWFNVP
jgi:V8-like Glu-specific endopeptidase